MKFNDMTISEYCLALKSKTSVPGGGSALALTLEMACSLALMTARFTIDKKGYENYQTEIKSSIDKLENFAIKAHELIDLDGLAFQALMKAYSNKNQNEIAEKSEEASEIPYLLYKYTKDVEDLASRLMVIGNKNVASDASIAVDLCKAIYPGCILNIKANISNIKNEGLRKKYLDLL